MSSTRIMVALGGAVILVAAVLSPVAGIVVCIAVVSALVYGVERQAELRRAQQRIELLEDLATSELLRLRTAEAAYAGRAAAEVGQAINGPLTAVLLGIDLARSCIAEPTPDVEGALVSLEGSIVGARRVAEVVEDLYPSTVERMDGTLDIADLLRGAARGAHNEIMHRAMLEEKYPSDLRIRGDAAALHQVFLNLLLNAAQSIEAGSAAANTIEVEAAATTAGILVSIRDSGIGIPRAEQDSIFEPFFTTKPKGLGSGLGLALCRRIVRDMDGEIWFESEPGNGTTFFVRLPVAEAAVDFDVASIAADRPRRAMVVDDDVGVLTAISTMLRLECDVVRATSVDEAVGILDGGDRDFDMILCDVMMPGRTGIELYDHLDGSDQGLARRLVFMTGGAFTPETQDFLKSNTVPVLRKPAELSELLNLWNRFTAA